ncbi:MAG: sodium:proton antiporter [Spirochaetales bacterium]|nr:sodium:proton antiporter [Spirochaetales bacterium]
MAFSIALIVVISLFLGFLLEKIGIPALVGMLGLGMVMSAFDLLDPSLLAVGVDLRMIALIIILLRAGLQLSFKTLKKVGRQALLLSFLPAFFEAGAITLFGPLFLDLSRMESLLLGSVLAAVSPAVVVPMMIRFIDEKQGTDKGIPTLVLAGASLDDIIVIVAFSAILQLYVGEDVNLVRALLSIPISLILGIGIGLFVGLFLYHIFSRYDPRATKRALIILGCAIFFVTSEQWLEAMHIPFAALVGVMAIGFIILQKNEEMAKELSSKFAKIWIFSEMLLFVLVGAQVDLSVAVDAGLNGIGLLLVGLFFRSVGTYLTTLGSPFSLKERLFIIIAYLPKATVQAAIGGTTLITLNARGLNPEPGQLILAMAVLSILLTAPLGSWAIAWAGRTLLVQEPRESSIL